MLGTSEQRPGTNAMSMMKSNTFGYAQNCGTSKMKWLMVNNAQVCGFNARHWNIKLLFLVPRP